MRAPMPISAALLGLLLTLAAGAASAQKYGGTLHAMQAANPPSLSLYDETTVLTSFVMQPVYNNLVYYDPLQPRESLETIIPELAESWQWNAERTRVTFALRRGVTFHDGRPFTSADAKTTYDIARGASTKRTKLNPRKAWWFNVKDIATNGDFEIAITLKRPQPSLMAMLAAGFSAVYPAHAPPADWRIKANGTGPFVLKDFKRDQHLLLEKNPAYWVKGRPYLDGIRFSIISERAAKIAAFATKQVYIENMSETTRPLMEAYKVAQPALTFLETPRTAFPSVVFNTNKPPFNDARLRQVVSLALDRVAYDKSVFRGGMVQGGVMLPPPAGAWGLPADELATLPGYGNIDQARVEARRIMTELGYSEAKPLKTKFLSRTLNFWVSSATWIASALKPVWIDIEIQAEETGVAAGIFARRGFTIAFFSSGGAADDPDVNFYEQYGCNSQRNYSDYCVQEVQALFDRQSEMTDNAERLKLVREIDKRLVTDVARVVFGARINWNARWPFVKNYVPHQAHYSYGRMQEVWLDQ
ncbi:MAG: ABC transporter substrate-binding protein [Candidatus Lambdaproteobacteria bacterium]|nr:ABC transporter substrate-binding protein [Candidatus Lambdaproteobacteria bacterium]